MDYSLLAEVVERAQRQEEQNIAAQNCGAERGRQQQLADSGYRSPNICLREHKAERVWESIIEVFPSIRETTTN